MADIGVSEMDGLFAGAGEWALFDVREAGEADQGHIFGATFLPRRQIELRMGDLVPARATTLVVYDEGGPRAGYAAATLERYGYEDVRVLKGGTQAWTKAGRELVQGSNVPSKLFGEEVYEHEQVPQLPVATLQAWRDEGRPHLVCDIRTPDEYQTARIPGAHGAFGADLARLAGDLRERRVPIVVHCAGRTRSIIACQSLRALGVENVFALENGTMGWQLAGYALERNGAAGELRPSAASLADGERRARILATNAGVTAIEPSGLDAALAGKTAGKANLYLFDVRQLTEYLGGHIDGAIAVPGGLAIQRTDEFAPVRASRTVLVDDGEARAWLTGYWLRRAGRSCVQVLLGGVQGWLASGRSLVSGRGRSRPLGAEAAAAASRVAAAELAKERDALAVDVDTSRYYAKARLPGARWIPYGWLEVRIGEHAPNREAPLVLTCHDGRLSGYAAANLAALGYRRVRVLEGGVQSWAKQGLRVDSGWPPELPPPGDLVVPPYDSSLASMARYLAWEQQLTARRRTGVSHC